MVTESVLWTMLPNGIDRETGRCRSTIFVSPRLQPGADANELGQAPLKAFETFAQWPQTLQRLKFAIEVDGIGVIGVQPIDLIGVPDPALWDLLMYGAVDGGVAVGGHQVKEHVDSDVHSFPADTIARQVLDLYTQIGSTSGTEYPPVSHPALDDLADDLADLGDIAAEDRHLGELYRGRRRHGSGRHVPADVARADRRTAFRLAYRFYDRRLGDERLRDASGPIDADAVPPPPERPLLEFHRYLAAFGDYPEVLRRLGLAIDVLHDDEPPALERAERYRVVVDGDAAPFMTVDTARPWTHFRRHDRFFVVAEHDGRFDSIDGQLRLDDSERWALHQIDIDGSAIKTTSTAATVGRQQSDQAASASSTEETATLPALRGGGMTLVRIGAVDPLVEQLDRTHELSATETAAGEIDLWAQDLVRGHRLDVEVDGSGRFWSLCERIGTFTYHGPGGPQPIDIRPDEGYVKGTSTTSVPGDTDLYLHEAVASWNGWSVVAPRPGGGVDEHDEADEGASALDRNRAQGKDPLPADLPLEVRFRPRPGTLPPLRFGRQYRMRALTVDLAGNSIDRDDTGLGDEHATAPAPFLRWDPVPPPVVVPRREYDEGASQLRMVIRSTADTTVEEWLALDRVQALRGVPSGLPYDAADERWIVAPATSQQLAEFHGVFDQAIASGDPAAIQEAFAIASRESGQLNAFEAGETLELPYLPDVSSRGVRFNRFFLENGYRRIDWPSDAGVSWHDRQPFRVRLVQGPWDAPVVPVGAHQLPTWDAATRVLTVPVPQAEQRTVRLSSAVTEADLDLQGMYPRLMDAAAASADPNAFAFARGDALDSRTWMLTPWIELTFVHAVEKPLADPVLVVPPSGMTRTTGDTFCVLDGVIANHAKSTGRLDIDATWTEQVDDILRDVPEDGVNGLPSRPVQGHVGDFLLVADEDECQVGRDEAPPAQPSVNGVGSSQGRVHRLRHEMGSTHHRVVTYQARATTRFREYFGPEVTDDASLITRTGPLLQRHVPSSRRPDPPDVAYIVPTMRWSEEQIGPVLGRGRDRLVLGATRRTRHGGGLRIYLRRPWYSSGDGELLGVVLADQPWFTYPIDRGLGMVVAETDQRVADQAARTLIETGTLKGAGASSLDPAARLLRGAGLASSVLQAPAVIAPAELTQSITSSLGVFDGLSRDLSFWKFGPEAAKLITQTGSDPVFASAAPAPGPLIHHFGLRTAVRTGLSLGETNRATFTVVGHQPEYDATRGLWFCDVDLDAGRAYTPMVRLALARFQPWSIDDAHLSAVRHADWAQVLPRRTATWRRNVGGVVSVEVEGPSGVGRLGAGLFGAAGIRASRRMTVRLQRLPSGADPELGWVDVGSDVELTPTIDRAIGYGSVTWSGRILVSGSVDGTVQRVVLEEFELHASDAGDPVDALGDVVGSTSDGQSVRTRLVYADTFAI